MENLREVTTSVEGGFDGMKRFGKMYVLDWATVAVVGVLYGLVEYKAPFHRMFRLDDPSIQFPMTEHETVSSPFCIVLAYAIPSVLVCVLPIVLGHQRNRMQLVHVSFLGLTLAFVLNGFFINCLKMWLGRPRPDFLARCIPSKETAKDILVGIEVCTNPNMDVINEGLKSTPSGHSGTSFSGLGYFSLWLAGQLFAFRPATGIYRAVVALM
jgi:diacylglycerol diphosphate phosphatase/phosphatidate phosphatase